VRAELAKSDFANLLTHANEPRLQASEHLRTTNTRPPKRLPEPLRKGRRCADKAHPARAAT
jgi:hypothetical protein